MPHLCVSNRIAVLLADASRYLIIAEPNVAGIVPSTAKET